jgi:hypothetical protein
MTEISFMILVAITGVSFFSYKAIKSARVNKEPMTISMIAEVTRFLKEVEIARQEYFTKPVKDKLVDDYKGVYEFFNKLTYSKIKKPK